MELVAYQRRNRPLPVILDAARMVALFALLPIAMVVAVMWALSFVTVMGATFWQQPRGNTVPAADWHAVVSVKKSKYFRNFCDTPPEHEIIALVIRVPARTEWTPGLGISSVMANDGEVRYQFRESNASAPGALAVSGNQDTLEMHGRVFDLSRGRTILMRGDGADVEQVRWTPKASSPVELDAEVHEYLRSLGIFMPAEG